MPKASSQEAPPCFSCLIAFADCVREGEMELTPRNDIDCASENQHVEEEEGYQMDQRCVFDVFSI